MYKTTTRAFAWLGILGAVAACGGDPPGASNPDNTVGGKGAQGQSGGARTSGGSTHSATGGASPSVVDSSYSIIEKSLNAASGNLNNGLVPAWCNSSGTPVAGFSGAPMYFQNDSTRTPFRVGQDFCYFGEARAHAYLAKISAFYAGVGVANIVNGYDLNGTRIRKRCTRGSRRLPSLDPAAVGAMSDPQYQQFVDDAYASVATLQLTAGTIYYQKSWTALSLLMLTGNFVNFAAL